MIDDDSPIIYSPLCQELTRDGHTIRILIYEEEKNRWFLEVEDKYWNSSVWKELFETDQAALDELHRTIEEEGISALIGTPPSRPLVQERSGLSKEERDELDDFLMCGTTSEETMMLDELDGYLTAIVSGPVTITPSIWLPRVWGLSLQDEPVFDTVEQANHITGMIMRHMNGIITCLVETPEKFEPIIDVASFPDDPQDYPDGEMWSHGYMIGIEICRRVWDEFFTSDECQEALRPIRLLGADELSEEQQSLTETTQQRVELTAALAASAVWIYQFWLPHRQAIYESTPASTYQRENPKIGRNDPCPCGSGKKFKKCCGASATLH